MRASSHPTTSRAYAATPPDNCATERGRLVASSEARYAHAFSHRTPPVQYAKTRFPLNRNGSRSSHSRNCEKRRMGARTAPSKKPSRDSYQLRTSRSTTSDPSDPSETLFSVARAASAWNAKGSRRSTGATGRVATDVEDVCAPEARRASSKGTISGTTRTDASSNKCAQPRWRFQSMRPHADAISGSFVSLSSAAIKASTPSAGPAAVPLMPSAATRIFPVTPAASHAARSRAASASGSDTRTYA